MSSGSLNHGIKFVLLLALHFTLLSLQSARHFKSSCTDTADSTWQSFSRISSIFSGRSSGLFVRRSGADCREGASHQLVA